MTTNIDTNLLLEVLNDSLVAAERTDDEYLYNAALSLLPRDASDVIEAEAGRRATAYLAIGFAAGVECGQDPSVLHLLATGQIAPNELPHVREVTQQHSRPLLLQSPCLLLPPPR